MRLKVLPVLTLLLALCCAPLGSSVRYNKTLTITSGTPIQLATVPTFARAIFIQMAASGSGIGYVMAGIPPGTTPNHSTSGQLTAQLAPASATSPGGNYSDNNALGIDIARIWIDGANSGDTVIVSWDQL
jgi:hypothetical protein